MQITSKVLLHGEQIAEVPEGPGSVVWYIGHENQTKLPGFDGVLHLQLDEIEWFEKEQKLVLTWRVISTGSID